MAVLGLRFCARSLPSCGKWGALLIAVRGPLTIAASLVAEHRLQTRRVSSCGSRVQVPRGMWDLPRPGLEPVSPALAGRLSTTAPPGKPQQLDFWQKCKSNSKESLFNKWCCSNRVYTGKKCVDSLGSSLLTIMPYVNRDSCISSFPIRVPLISFSCFIALARTSSAVLNSSGEGGSPCLVPNLVWGGGRFYMLYTKLRKLSSITSFLRLYIMNEFWIL